jgi:protein tyrosine phosphatase
MIASQGPTKKNQMDFWKMIVQENVGKFVSLFEENQNFLPSE